MKYTTYGDRVDIDSSEGYAPVPTSGGSLDMHIACGLIVGDREIHRVSCPMIEMPACDMTGFIEGQERVGFCIRPIDHPNYGAPHLDRYGHEWRDPEVPSSVEHALT